VQLETHRNDVIVICGLGCSPEAHAKRWYVRHGIRFRHRLR
jgi:hypothetical protein